MTRRCLAFLVFVFFVGLGWIFLKWHEVDIVPSAMDEKIIMEHIIRPASIAAPFKTYDEEIKAIQLVQQSILKLAPLNEGIPLGRPREPATLIEAGKGLCYDRSRVIE